MLTRRAKKAKAKEARDLESRENVSTLPGHYLPIEMLWYIAQSQLLRSRRLRIFRGTRHEVVRDLGANPELLLLLRLVHPMFKFEADKHATSMFVAIMSRKPGAEMFEFEDYVERWRKQRKIRKNDFSDLQHRPVPCIEFLFVVTKFYVDIGATLLYGVGWQQHGPL